MSGERLELVTDFSSLRVGMVVVTKDCGLCGASHRCILMPPNGLFTTCPDGSVVNVPAYVMEPQPPCDRRPSSAKGRTVVGPLTVAMRKVYRVVDDLDTDADEQTAFEDAIRASVRRAKAVSR